MHRWTRHRKGLDQKNPSLQDAPGSLPWIGWAGHLSCALGLYGPHPRPAPAIPSAPQPSSQALVQSTSQPFPVSPSQGGGSTPHFTDGEIEDAGVGGGTDCKA